MNMQAPPASTIRRVRDPRLDFFRGLGMFIILLAHIPNNTWHNWIPARFGFSDAADMFVFCSGMASALAFGSVFAERGWWMGSARIIHRIWQVYWAHIGSIMVVAALLVAADRWFGDSNYFAQFTFDKMFSPSPARLLDLMTLRYIPELYFDILPMYLALLAMIPFVMLLARVHVVLVFVFMAALWLLAFVGQVNLPAQPEGGRVWYFNPLAWQLVFFSGFALVRGWWPAPPRDWQLLAVCIAYVAGASLVACQGNYYCHAGFGYVPLFGEISHALEPWTEKTNQGVLRYIHFMATVYIAWYVAGEKGSNLTGPAVELIRRVGTQTLAVFLASLAIGPLLGIFIERVSRESFLVIAFANILGLVLLVMAGRITGWFKSSPWRSRQRTQTGSSE